MNFPTHTACTMSSPVDMIHIAEVNSWNPRDSWNVVQFMTTGGIFIAMNILIPDWIRQWKFNSKAVTVVIDERGPRVVNSADGTPKGDAIEVRTLEDFKEKGLDNVNVRFLSTGRMMVITPSN